MTDLTRERLAELRKVAEAALPDFGPISDVHLAICQGWSRAVENRRFMVAANPKTVLALIAQCEAGLPASGGVSGDDGELVKRLREHFVIATIGPEWNLGKTFPPVCTEAADRIAALLAERDGLKAERDQARTNANAFSARTTRAERALADATTTRDLFERRLATSEDLRTGLAGALTASRAALADALGLLREVRLADVVMLSDGLDEKHLRTVLVTEYSADWLARRDALLTKHGPSP